MSRESDPNLWIQEEVTGMKRKKAVMIGLLILAALCIGYFVLYITAVDTANRFTWFWLLAGAGLLACDGLLFLLQRQGYHMPEKLRLCIMAVAGLFVVIFLATEGVIIGYGRSQPDQGADYAIVLGARVIGRRPSYNLEKRLEKAYDYLRENPDTKAVLSGGRGFGEDISEAQAMCDYLVKRGISKERLIPEDCSANTDQNLEYSLQKMSSPKAKVVLISNRFHIYRAVKIAQKKGMTHVQGLGSVIKWYTVPNMYVREAFAVIKYKLCGQI